MILLIVIFVSSFIGVYITLSIMLALLSDLEDPDAESLSVRTLIILIISSLSMAFVITFIFNDILEII